MYVIPPCLLVGHTSLPTDEQEAGIDPATTEQPLWLRGQILPSNNRAAGETSRIIAIGVLSYSDTDILIYHVNIMCM